MKLYMIMNKVKEVLGIENRLYGCEQCGEYAPKRVFIRGIEPYEHIKIHFCCEKCRDLYIDDLLPPQAKRYK